MPDIDFAAKFVGRPASKCRQCGSGEFYANTFGGIECCRCSGDGVSPKLYVVAGVWSDEPDEWETSECDREHESDANQSVLFLDRLFPEEAKQELHKRSAWGDDELELLVDWYHANRGKLPTQGPLAFHSPERIARSLSDLNWQLSGQIVSPEGFYRVLDIEIDVQGPQGPRVATGTLKADLRRLREIAEEAGSEAREEAETLDFAGLLAG